MVTTRVLCAFMPGVHSSGKLADRRRRAIDRRYVGQRPPGIVGKKFAAVASTVAVSSSADNIEEDPLRLNDPWACYTAATSCRGLASVFSTASCGAPCSNVGPPAAAFNASAKVFAPADAAVELASNSWEQLAFAQQHTISSLTQQSLFLSQAVCAAKSLPATSVLCPSASSVEADHAQPCYYGDADSAVLAGLVDALTAKVAHLTNQLASLQQSLPSAVESSIDKRMPSLATHQDLAHLQTVSKEIEDATRDRVKERKEEL